MISKILLELNQTLPGNSKALTAALLATVVENEARPTITELAEIAQVPPGTVSKAVTFLVRLGFATKIEDGRRAYLSPTDKGIAFIKGLG